MVAVGVAHVVAVFFAVFAFWFAVLGAFAVTAYASFEVKFEGATEIGYAEIEAKMNTPETLRTFAYALCLIQLEMMMAEALASGSVKSDEVASRARTVLRQMLDGPDSAMLDALCVQAAKIQEDLAASERSARKDDEALARRATFRVLTTKEENP